MRYDDPETKAGAPAQLAGDQQLMLKRLGVIALGPVLRLRRDSDTATKRIHYQA